MSTDTWSRRAALQALFGNVLWLNACGGGAGAPAAESGSIELIADDVGLVWAPRIAAAADGTLWLAWIETTPAGWQQAVAARVAVDHAVTLWPIDTNAAHAYAQWIVMASSGPVIAWTEEAVTGWRLRASAWSGHQWVDEQDWLPADAGTDSWYGEPQLASSSSGRVALAWTEALNAGGSRLWVAQRAATGNWTPPALVRTSATLFPWAPSIAIDDAGDAMVVWQEYSAGAGSSLRLMWSICQSGGTAWSTPVPLDSGEMGEARVASPVAGVWVLAWQSIDAPNEVSLRSRHFIAGAWSAARVNVSGAESIGPFALDARAGIVQAAWTVWNSVMGQSAVRVARTDWLGSPWSASTSIFTSTTTQPTLPRVRLQADGRAAVTWAYSQGDRSPWIATGATASTWNAARRLDDDPVWSSNAPDVVALNDGWVSTWYRFQDGGKLDVLLRRLR